MPEHSVSEEDPVKLLFLSANALSQMRNGSSLRAHHLLSRLPSQYHVSYLNLDEFAKPVRQKHGIIGYLLSILATNNPYPFCMEFKNAFSKAIATEEFHIVMLMGVNLLQYLEGCNIPVVADLVDEPVIAALREALNEPFSITAARSIKHIFELLVYERRYCHIPKHTILAAATDATWLRRIVRGVEASVLPNGVDLQHFQVPNTPLDPNEIVFTGNMSFPPNIAAVKYFSQQVYPRILERRPNCKWTIVGASPDISILALANSNGISVTGSVDDIRQYISSAAIVISPLVSGGGIKNKILEAWAMKKAIVTTPLGCAGILVEHGVDILLAHSAAEFAEQTLHLLDSPVVARRLGESGYRKAVNLYSWDDKATKLHNILQAAIC